MSSQVALITGCSSGIGRDLANALTLAGYTIVATARKAADLNDLDAALKLSLDVTDNASIHKAIKKTLDELGRIDLLINNAGYAFRSVVEEISDEKLHALFDVNVYGVIRMVRAVAPVMRAQHSGRIVNIGSISGKIVLPVSGPYCASKYALEAFSDAMRLELSPFGIFVVLIEPGNINTNFMQNAVRKSDGALSNPDSPYKKLYENYLVFNERMRKVQADPSAVSAAVLKSLAAKRPKARYRAAVPLPNLLLTYLGDRLKDRILKAKYQISRKIDF